MEKFQNKSSSKGCKWPSLNVPGTKSPLTHPILKMEFSLPIISPLGNKNWPPSMKVKKLETFQNKGSLKGFKWSSLNAPGTKTPLSHPILKLGEFPIPPLLALWGNKNWPRSMEVKKVQ